MMIAFITLEEVVQYPWLIVYLARSSRGYVHIFWLAVSEEKIWLGEKATSPRSIPPPSIYIHMCTLYTYTNTNMLSGFLRLSRCLVPTSGLTSRVPHKQCVCVCVYTHTPYTLPPASKNSKNTDDTGPYLSLCPKQPPMPSNKCSS